MRRAGVVVAGALALLAVGCGRGDDGEEVTTVREIDLLQSVEDAGSFRATFSLVDEVPSAGGAPTVVSFALEGVVDPTERAYDLSGRVTFDRGGDDEADGTDLVLGYRSDGASSWARVGDEDARWFSLDDLDDLGGPLADGAPDAPLAAALTDPVALMEELRDRASEFTEVGDEELDGVPTTRYRARLVDDGDPFDVWVDTEGRPHRVEADGATLTLGDWGVPVEVVAPDDVADPSDLGDLVENAFPPAGEWERRAAGDLDGAAWEVWRAPYVGLGEPSTCWTFEVEGAAPSLLPGAADLPGSVPDAVADELDDLLGALPTHGGHLATCLPDGIGERRLIVLDGFPDRRVAPVALVVADELADVPAVVVGDDGSEVEVPLTDGVGVFDPAGTTALLVEVRLADGALACPLRVGRFTEPGEVASVGPCVDR